MTSQYLDGILSRHNRATNLKVVFVDVASYSKRRSQSQADVVDAFMECLRSARKSTAQHFIEYSEANKISFAEDIIILPSGDGAAVCFPFEGIHDVHLHFAKELLKAVHAHNEKQKCDRFSDEGWCNCHSGFKLTVGISDGKGILYRDVNGGYNVAGNVINMAARVMGKAGHNQIVFTDEAYRQIVDMVDDPHLDEKFREFKDVKIKHGLKISVYQYVETGLIYLNADPPEDLALAERAEAALSQLSKIGFPNPLSKLDNEPDKKKMMATMEAFARGLSSIFSEGQIIEAGGAERPNEKQEK